MNENKTRVSFFKQNPMAQAVATKLVHGQGLSGNTAQYGTMDQFAPGPHELNVLARRQARAMQDSASIFEVLPDTELTMQVVVSSILSPNDMTRIDLNWKLTECGLPGELTGPMLDLLRDYFEEDYKIKSLLPKIVEDALFKTGSYPIIIIPESSLDDLINTNNAISMESLNPYFDRYNTLAPKGFLASVKQKEPQGKGDKKRNVGIEGYFRGNGVPTENQPSNIDDNLLIVDNYETLLIPKILEKHRSQSVASITRTKVRASLEQHLNTDSNGNKKITPNEFNNLFYRRNSHGASTYTRIKTSDQTSRPNIGHPLDMTVPSDSLIPIHIPGKPDEHVGYFLLTDEFGNPLSYSRNADVYEQFASSRLEGDAAGNILKRVRDSQSGSASTVTEWTGQKLTEVYQRHVEEDLRERLRRGINGQNVELAHVNDIYRIMLHRTLGKRQSQLVFIPAELVTYFAYDYTNMGLGRSLLDKSKTLASIRAILLFANTMAAIKNSVNHREIGIELDPDDPEPDATVEKLLTEVMRVQDNTFPFTSTSPGDIIPGLVRAGISVAVSGNPNYPETKVSVQDQASQRVEVSTELDDKMRDRHTMALGAVPELVNSSTDVEFAAELLTKNLLFRKQTAVKSEITSQKLTEFVAKYTLNDGKLLADLIELVENHRTTLSEGVRDRTIVDDAKDASIVRDRTDFDSQSAPALECINEFIAHLRVELPQIDDTKLEQQMSQFKEYVDALDATLPTFINRESIGMMMGDEAEGMVDSLLAVVKGYYTRRWLANNNVMPELMELLSSNRLEEEPLNLLEKHEEMITGLSSTLMSMAKRLKERFTPKDENAEHSDSYSSSTPSESTDDSDMGSDNSFDTDF